MVMKKRLLFLTLLVFGSTAHAVTLSQLRTNARLLIKDTSTSRQRYTDTQINNFINEAQRDVINNTWALSKNTSITLVLGTTYYTVPTDLIGIQRITYERRNIPETSLIKQDGDFSNSSWETSNGPPRFYFQDPSQTTKIGVFPWPQNSASTGTLRMIYYAQAVDLSADSDVPFNSEVRFTPYQDVLEYFVAYRVYLLEGEVDKAGLYRQEYESRLGTMAGRIGMKSNFNPSFSGPSTSR